MKSFHPSILLLAYLTLSPGCHKNNESTPVGPTVTDHLVEFVCTTSSKADLMSVAYRIKDSTAMYSVEGNYWNSIVRLHTGTSVGLTCAGASTSRSVITVEAKIKLDSLEWKSAAASDTFNVRVSLNEVIP